MYFPELEEKISMATEPEETRTFYGWFGCLSPETKGGGKTEYCKRYHKRIRIVFLLIYFIHQIKFWVLACRFVRIGMPIFMS